MQRRWQRFGIDATRLRHTLANCREFLANPVPYDRRPGGDSSWRLAIADRTMLGVLGWLEYSTRTDKLEDWRERAAEVPRMAVRYFFGAWRDGYVETVEEPPLTVRECRRRLAWVDTYCAGMMWALVLNDVRSLRKLLDWPDTDLPPDEGVREPPVTKLECEFHVLLAKWLRGDSAASQRPLRAAIERSAQRSPKLLLAVLDAIIGGDRSAVGAAMVDHLKYHAKRLRSREPVPGPPEWGISFEGTILWHVARREGVEPAGVEEKWADLVIRP